MPLHVKKIVLQRVEHVPALRQIMNPMDLQQCDIGSSRNETTIPEIKTEPEGITPHAAVIQHISTPEDGHVNVRNM